MRLLILTALIGVTGCATPNDSGICTALAGSVAGLRDGLMSHPETADAVGEPATDIVIGLEAACS